MHSRSCSFSFSNNLTDSIPITFDYENGGEDDKDRNSVHAFTYVKRIYSLAGNLVRLSAFSGLRLLAAPVLCRGSLKHAKQVREISVYALRALAQSRR